MRKIPYKTYREYELEVAKRVNNFYASRGAKSANNQNYKPLTPVA